MAITTTSAQTFITSILIGDYVNTPINDSLPTLTKVGGQPVSAALEVQSTNGAILFPRITTASRNDMNVTNGMVVYNRDTNAFNFYENGGWTTFGGAADVTGPNDSIDGDIAIFNGTTGKIIADSGVHIGVIPEPLQKARKAKNLTAPGDELQLSGIGILAFGDDEALSGSGSIFVGTENILNLFVEDETFLRSAVFTDGETLVPTSSSALVELNSTTGALLISRMTTAQMNALDAENGMMIYNTDDDLYYFHQDGDWASVGTGEAPDSAKYIIQEADVNIPNAQSLGTLTTGILFNTVTGSTGVLSSAEAGTDYYAPGEPTTIIDTHVAAVSPTNSGNFFIGTNTGNETLTGQLNVGIAYGVLNNITTGEGNTSGGYLSSNSLTIGNRNSSWGAGTHRSLVGGDDNSSFGYESGYSNVSGSRNSHFGSESAFYNESSRNSTFGYRSSFLNVSGNDISAFGDNCLANNLVSENSGYGSSCLAANESGTGLSGFGFRALLSNVDGINHASFGNWTLRSLSNGDGCSAFGFEAGSSQTTLTNCSFFGKNADADANGLTNATAIGANSVVAVSNALVLGNNANVGIGTSSPTEKLHVEGAFKQKNVIRYVAAAQTTNDTLTTLLTVPIPISPSTAVRVKVGILAIQSDASDSCYGTSDAAAYYDGASTAAVGALPSITLTTTAGFATTAAAWSVSGNNLLLRVTGIAGQTINWECTYEYQTATV